MTKTGSTRRVKKIRGEAYEIIAIMAILCCQTIERRFTPHAQKPSSVVNTFKDKEFLKFMRQAFAHDKDLNILARDFGTFIRVIERVARER